MKKISWIQHYYYNLKHHVVNKKRVDKDGPATGLVALTWALIGLSVLQLLENYEQVKMAFLFCFFVVLFSLQLHTYRKRGEIEEYYKTVEEPEKLFYKRSTIYFLTFTLIFACALVWWNRPGK